MCGAQAMIPLPDDDAVLCGVRAAVASKAVPTGAPSYEFSPAQNKLRQVGTAGMSEYASHACWIHLLRAADKRIYISSLIVVQCCERLGRHCCRGVIQSMAGRRMGRWMDVLTQALPPSPSATAVSAGATLSETVDKLSAACPSATAATVLEHALLLQLSGTAAPVEIAPQVCCYPFCLQHPLFATDLQPTSMSYACFCTDGCCWPAPSASLATQTSRGSHGGTKSPAMLAHIADIAFQPHHQLPVPRASKGYLLSLQATLQPLLLLVLWFSCPILKCPVMRSTTECPAG